MKIPRRILRKIALKMSVYLTVLAMLINISSPALYTVALAVENNEAQKEAVEETEDEAEAEAEKKAEEKSKAEEDEEEDEDEESSSTEATADKKTMEDEGAEDDEESFEVEESDSADDPVNQEVQGEENEEAEDPVSNEQDSSENNEANQQEAEVIVEPADNIEVDDSNNKEEENSDEEKIGKWKENKDGSMSIVVEEGEEYEYKESGLKIEFKEIEDKTGEITVEEIELTDEQVERLGAISNKAWDITSEMENGTFEYELTLPTEEDLDEDSVKVVYTEDKNDLDSEDESKIKEVNKKDVKVGEKEKDEKREIRVDNLDHFTIFVIVEHTGNMGSFMDWDYVDCGERSSSGNDYLKMTKKSSSLTSPTLDFSNTSEESLSFKARTFGGTKNSSNVITVSISTDGGNTWDVLGTRVPTKNQFQLQNIFNLSEYNGFDIKIKIETLSANSGRGIGIDDIIVEGVEIEGDSTDTCPDEVDNPNLSATCGLDIALVIDNSNSINSGELEQMKIALKNFVDALAGTPTQFSVTKFGKEAFVLQPFTANIQEVKDAINLVSTGGGSTNWKEAINKARGTYDPRENKPNLMIFASDGNPTHPYGETNVTDPGDINDAVAEANLAKNENIRILALGIGDNLNIDNLKKISGSIVNADKLIDSDVITTDFSDMAFKLAYFAGQTCGGTITVNKYIDVIDSSQPTDRSGWQFDIGGVAEKTDNDGQTNAVSLSSGTYSVTETNVLSEYTFKNASCTKNGDSIGTLNVSERKIEGITITDEDIISCNFINSSRESCVNGPAWAYEVVSNKQGVLYGGGGITDPARIVPEEALGEVDEKFYSLGKGGEIILEFNHYVKNISGTDLTVYETTWNRSSDKEEKAGVFVSKNGSDWIYLGEASNFSDGNDDGNRDGITHFDFNNTSEKPDWIKFVKLVEASNNHIASDDGFDIDAVKGREGVCEEPKPKPEKPEYQCDSTMYAVNNSGDLFWYDFADNSTKKLDDIAFGSSASADDPFNDRTYYISRYGESVLKYYDHDLKTNVNVGSVEIPSSVFTKLAFDRYGKLYGLADSHNLYLINSTNGEASKLGTISGIGIGGDIVFDGNNTLYLIGTEGKLFTINLATLEKTLVKATGLNPVTGMAYIGGNFYVSNGSSDVFKMDKNGENVKITTEKQEAINDLSSCLPGIEPKCGDGIINGEEKCDGTAGITEGENFCSQSCQLVPIYGGENQCPDGMVEELVSGITLDSRSSEIKSLNLLGENPYLLKASGIYQYANNSQRKADSAYATKDDWNSVRNDVGVWGTNRGVSSIIGDLGNGMGVIEWNDDSGVNENNVYTKFIQPDGDLTAKFVISDWYGDWYENSCEGQSCMNDNNGHLNLELYECRETSTVEVCKEDEKGNSLEGWNLQLLGEKVGEVEVKTNGVITESSNLAPGDYVLVASGTYQYRGNSGLLTDANFSQRMESDGYDGPYFPWINVKDLSTAGALGIMVNGSPTNWSEYLADDNVYGLPIEDFPGGKMNFDIYDNYYNDNVGNLKVEIYKGHGGTTGDNGCFVLEDVELGNYQINETLKYNWENVSGLDEVLVDNAGETFTVVNKDQTPYCGDGKVNQVSEKCDGMDGVEEGKNFCSQSCQLIPIYNGGYECPGTTIPRYLEKITLDSNSSEEQSFSRTFSKDTPYLVKASGVYGFKESKPNEFADAAYATRDNWDSIVNDIGVWGEKPGANSIIGDLGLGMGLIKWNDGSGINSDHIYSKLVQLDKDWRAEFVISDWYGDWYEDERCKNQGCMENNTGNLELELYECVDQAELSDIHGVKWNDIDGDGKRNCLDDNTQLSMNFVFNPYSKEECELEPLLGGWTINLYKWVGDGYESKPIKTTETSTEEYNLGEYQFGDLLPGKYQVCEVVKSDEGWGQTSPGTYQEPECHEVNLPNDCKEVFNRQIAINCVEPSCHFDFGNQLIRSALTISKTNNEYANGPDKPGDLVTYTIEVQAKENGVKNAVMTDLPPETFEYVTGSWTANSNERGDLKSEGVTTEPTYASPGDWILGDMKKDEIVTLTYQARVGEETKTGVYPDLAWAQGESLAGEELIASSVESDFIVEEGIVDGTFVGTQIEVEAEKVPPTVKVRADRDEVIEEVEEEVKVLGAVFPVTGASNNWLLTALAGMFLGSLMIGLGYLIKNRRKMNFSKILGVLAGVVLTGFLAGSASAAGISVRLSDPADKTSEAFNLEFVAMDIQDREMIAECQKKLSSETDFVQFGSDIELKAGGNSALCPVDSGVLTENGDYDFRVVVTAEGDSSDSNIVKTSYKKAGPGPEKPKYIIKKDEDNCRNEIEFKTADDGQTTYVEIYRSQHSRNIVVNEDSLRKTIVIGPNKKYSFKDGTSSTGCGDNYFYAIRAFDQAGNASGVRAEVFEDIIEEKKIIEVFENQEGTVLGFGNEAGTGNQGGQENQDGQVGEGGGTETEGEDGAMVTDEGAQTEGTDEDAEVLGEQDDNGDSLFSDWRFWLAVVSIVGLGWLFYSRR